MAEQIKTLIIEDEEPAALRLIKLLKEISPKISILAAIDSIEGAVKWLNNNKKPNLIMLDIQLADGLSFEIFKQVTVDSFVIFTTAYDEYAIQAFELNSIDYLLKPIDKEKLKKSIEKYENLQNSTSQIQINELINTIESKKSNYKKRFLINIGSRIKSIETDKIAYFYILEKSTYLCTFSDKHYPIDFSLDKLENLVNPDTFFRISRQITINFKAINNINIVSKSRIKLSTKPKSEYEMLVSANKSHEFRIWLDR